MNIQLSGAEEWIDQQMTSVLGQVLIRYVLLLGSTSPCWDMVFKRERVMEDSGLDKAD
jgi:hypothetical protein